MGWVDAIRDHSQIIFIHLRDISGIVQVIFDSKCPGACYDLAATLKEEYVVSVTGRVAARASGTENPALETGGLEVFASDLAIVSKSDKLPFQISEKAMVYGEKLKSNPENVDEELRLQFRYLDMRRPTVQHHFLMRHRIVKAIRDHMDASGFVELETPVLTKSTPEGARDYLIPSRIQSGKFYALPQSPQLFKQLFMVGGMDRYYQIVKCFRDEDLRPNRQPEFTQLDLEASFIDEEFIFGLLEGLMVKIFAVGGIDLSAPFPRMTYREALDRYGSDRPDLRFAMAFESLQDIFQNTKYSIFQRIIRQNGQVKGFCIKGRARMLSKNLLQNEYALKIAPSFGAGGMSWMKVVNGKLESNIVQFFSGQELDDLRLRFGAEEGDVIIMVADRSPDKINKVLNKLRGHLAIRLDLIPQNLFSPVWITDFPLFEWTDNGLSPMHHPFTMPKSAYFDPRNRKQLLGLQSRAYDLVMNGEELGGGSIRIHQPELQRKIFQVLGMGKKEIEEKFGFFLRALQYGAPPHGGLALGLDRVVAMILNLPSIRDVIAFPKNRSAVCPLTGAPSMVEAGQLEELGLKSTPVLESIWKEPDLGSSATGGKEKMIEKISSQQVEHVAKLSRLQLNKKERDAYKKDLNRILQYVEMLNELNTDEIPPMHHVLEKNNVWREDEPSDPGISQDILKNAPETDGKYIKVPKILQG